MAAALLDLGADRAALGRALDSLPVDGFSVKISRVKKSGLDVCDFDVCLDAAHENHDHDMEYLFGGLREGERTAVLEVHGEKHSHGHVHEEEPHGHEHDHLHEEAHEHGHDHLHEGEHVHSHGHPHPHEHRGLREILHILDHADMTERARRIAERIFRILAEAEAKAHGVPVDEVHFHEVGAVDSIVDIVTAAVCLDNLDITEAVVPALAEGTGFVRCQHGMIPVPVPAVLNIVQAHHLRLRMTQIQGELVTPTGAAIAAAICTSHSLPESFEVIRTGLGAGKRKYERPSILRAMLIRSGKEEPEQGRGNGQSQMDGGCAGAGGKDCICRLETNIDDCTGEMLGCVMERLFEAGARDVHYIPVYMKKNRPAYQLNVICREEERERLEEIIFRETTTIGIRRVLMERTVLRRESREAETSLGTARVKVCSAQGLCRVYPEYESVAELSRRSGLPFQEVYTLIQRECSEGV